MRRQALGSVLLTVSHLKPMLSPKPSTSPLIQYLGPLLPLGCGGFGVWLLVSGRYVYRPGRSNSELIPLAPDAYLAAGFFISLAVLIAALGITGQLGRWLFWGGSIGSTVFLAIEAGLQLLGPVIFNVRAI